MSENIIFVHDGKHLNPEKIYGKINFCEEKIILSPLDTYKYDEYVTDIDNLKSKLQDKGVAIIPNLLNEKECKSMYDGMWKFLEHLTGQWEIPISRDNEKSWRQFSDLFTLHSMLMQTQGSGSVGHAQWLWDVRQNPKIINVFQKLWDTKEVLTSFDGASIHLPPEKTNKGWFHGKSWLHTDQSYTNSNNFSCVQSWVTACDVNEGDATLTFLEGSHKYHQTIAKKFNITDKSDWFKLSEEHIKAYTDLGCKLYRIKCPKGSMIMWLSTTIHCGQEAMKERLKPNIRCISYVCMLPKSLATEAMLKKKRKALEELRTTSHWPVKIKLFAKYPRTYGQELRPLNTVEKPILTELGKKIAGL